MDIVKVIDVNNYKNKSKPALEFPPEVANHLRMKKCRKVIWTREKDGYLISPIRTRTNRERVNNVRLPEGAFRTIKMFDQKNN